jgi:hypothetical protein
MLIINYPHPHEGNFTTFGVKSRHFVTSSFLRLTPFGVGWPQTRRKRINASWAFVQNRGRMNQQPESAAIGTVLAAVTDGTISPSEGATLANLLEAQRKGIETSQVEDRIRAVEVAASRQEKKRQPQ